jgi:hypothetical protein
VIGSNSSFKLDARVTGACLGSGLRLVGPGVMENPRPDVDPIRTPEPQLYSRPEVEKRIEMIRVRVRVRVKVRVKVKVKVKVKKRARY